MDFKHKIRHVSHQVRPRIEQGALQLPGRHVQFPTGNPVRQMQRKPLLVNPT